MNGWATWWIRPSSILLYFIIPLYVLLYYLPQLPIFSSVTLKTSVYFNHKMFVYGLLLLGAFYLGSMLPLAPKTTRKITQKEIDLVLDFLGVLSIVGYVYMLAPILLHPGLLLSALSSDPNALIFSGSIVRGSAGVGSLQQLCLPYFVVFFYTLFSRGAGAIPGRHRIAFSLLAGFTLFRAVFIAQRLALIELSVPVAVYFVHSRIRKAGPFETAIIGLFPILSVLFLILFFAGTEFLRSWDFHKEGGHFWDYIFGRMLTYYYTALNNGAVILQTSDWPTYAMTNILGWLYRLPFISDILVGLLGPKFYVSIRVLELYADPEFNNPSGLFPVIQDVGVPGAVIYYFFLGMWLSYCYRCFVIGAGWGAFYYPLIYLSSVEVLRILYMGGSKIIVQVFLFWIISVIVRWILLRSPLKSKRSPRFRGLRPSLRTRKGAVPARTTPMEQDTPLR